MNNCRECGKSIPDDRIFCSEACKKKWHNTDYYKRHKDQMKQSFKDRYQQSKKEKIEKAITTVRTKVGAIEAITSLSLPSGDTEKRIIQNNHFKMHGEQSIRLELYYFAVGRCTQCNENVFVNLPKKSMTDIESFEFAIGQKYTNPYRLAKLIKILRERGKLLEAEAAQRVFDKLTNS